MKRTLSEYGWVAMILVFIIMILVMLRIVDRPEEIGAAEDPTAVPQFVIDSAERWGEEYSISPEFLEAVAWVESRYRPEVSNGSGTCHGLMQISWSAHGSRMARLGVSDIFDPDGNMKTAADYLAELFEEYEDPNVVLAVYNGQSKSKVSAAMYDGYISLYAQEILDLTERLEEVHGKKEIEKKAHFGFELMWENGVG